MRVRAVAAGAVLAVWCVSGSAAAAGYAEVWNPPEETRHVTNRAGENPGPATKGKSTAGSKGAPKAAPRAVPKHTAGAGHAAPSVALARGNRSSAHGSVKKVVASGTAKSKAQGKAATTTRRKKPHAQAVQAKAGQPKVVQANLVQRRPAHPPAVKVAAKPDMAKPAAARVGAPVPPANPAPATSVDANPANASSNPATASSGSLPPILR